jgi:hypothetical protein
MARYGTERLGTKRYAEDVPRTPHEVFDVPPWTRDPELPFVVEVNGVEITLRATNKYLFMED